MQDDNSDLPQDRVSVEDIDNAPHTLSLARQVTVEEVDALYVRLSEAGNENFDLKWRVADLQHKLDRKDALDKLIGPYASRAFVFMCVYSAIVFILVVLDAVSLCGFSIPESVLGYLVGSTAATVIGLVGMVLTGVFVGARK